MAERHTVSIELLYHFRCGSCKRWWSVAGWTARAVVICPHCGLPAEVGFVDESQASQATRQ